MTLLLANFVFFAYAGMAFLVGLVSILWGGQAKIMGAGILLGSIIVSNIIYWLNHEAYLGVGQLSVGYAIMDLTLAYVFLATYSRSTQLQRHRWACYVAFIHLGMAGVNIVGAAQPDFAKQREYALVLNILMITALFICFIGFTPKSRNEAIGVVKMKWLYLMSDFFRRVIAPLRYGRRNTVAANKRGSSVKEIDARIGAKIREARILRELSQEKLGEAIGVSPSQVQKFESGANRVSASTLFALSEFLGVDVSFFYTDIEVGGAYGVIKN